MVVPVPTVRAHVRERGYDHALLIAKSIAARRGLGCKVLLGRRINTRQRGAGRRERFRQAGEAFTLRTTHIPAKVLLVDDVVTTGATLHFTAKILKDAGVQTVFAAVIAKQPLDQTGKI